MQQSNAQLKPRQAYKAYLILVISLLLFAGNVIAGKLIAGKIPSIGLSALRGLLGFSVLLPLAWSQIKNSPRPNRREVLHLFLLGLFGIALSYSTFIIGLKYTTGTNASIIFATAPTTTIALLAIRYKSKPSKRQLGGIIASFIGLLIVFTQGNLRHILTLNLGIGDLFLMGNVLSVCLFNISSQSFMRKFSSVVTSVYALACGTLLILPYGIWELISQPWRLSFTGWLTVLYMGCCVTGIAFFFSLYGIHQIGSGRASIFSNLCPVFSIVLSVLILGETLSDYHVIGFTLALFGIGLALSPRSTVPA